MLFLSRFFILLCFVLSFSVGCTSPKVDVQNSQEESPVEVALTSPDSQEDSSVVPEEESSDGLQGAPSVSSSEEKATTKEPAPLSIEKLPAAPSPASSGPSVSQPSETHKESPKAPASPPKAAEDTQAVLQPPSQEQPPNQSPRGLYGDGVHRGSGSGREGNIEVEVKVEGGQIVQIDVLSHHDTPNLAKNVFRRLTQQIITSQEVNVDTISGATVTSKGFIQAVKNSLKP